MRDPADGLHDRVEPATRRPRPDVAESAQRHEDDAGAQPRERLGRESTLAEGPGPISLREHVGRAHQSAQRLDLLRLTEIKMGGELAVARVVFLVGDVRWMR